VHSRSLPSLEVNGLIYAGFWLRVLSLIIDGAIIMPAAIVVYAYADSLSTIAFYLLLSWTHSGR